MRIAQRCRFFLLIRAHFFQRFKKTKNNNLGPHPVHIPPYSLSPLVADMIQTYQHVRYDRRLYQAAYGFNQDSLLQDEKIVDSIHHRRHNHSDTQLNDALKLTQLGIVGT